MKKTTSFRSWVERMWYDHKIEVETYSKKFPEYSKDEYFKKYRWWLKKEYRTRIKKGLI